MAQLHPSPCAGCPVDRENKPSKVLLGNGLPPSLLALCLFAELQAWTLTAQATCEPFWPFQTALCTGVAPERSLVSCSGIKSKIPGPSVFIQPLSSPTISIPRLQACGRQGETHFLLLYSKINPIQSTARCFLRKAFMGLWLKRARAQTLKERM